VPAGAALTRQAQRGALARLNADPDQNPDARLMRCICQRSGWLRRCHAFRVPWKVCSNSGRMQHFRHDTINDTSHCGCAEFVPNNFHSDHICLAGMRFNGGCNKKDVSKAIK
jgi:hypothetical protein